MSRDAEGPLLLKPPPTLEAAEKVPAEIVEPEWMGVMPAAEDAD